MLRPTTTITTFMIMHRVIEMCITGRENMFEEGALHYILYIYQALSFDNNLLNRQLNFSTGYNLQCHKLQLSLSR